MSQTLILQCPKCFHSRSFEVVKSHGNYSGRCAACNELVWFEYQKVQDAIAVLRGLRSPDPEPEAPQPSEPFRGKAWIAAEAARLVSGDRNRQHGDTLDNHTIIAHFWNALLRSKFFQTTEFQLSALDVANMMELLKVARRYTGGHNLDDYVDGAGYACVAGDIAERLNRQKQ